MIFEGDLLDSAIIIKLNSSRYQMGNNITDNPQQDLLSEIKNQYSEVR